MYNVKIKTFYDGRKSYLFATLPIVGKLGNKGKKNEEQPVITDKIELLERAHRRTKQAIYDIAFNNVWEYFITVTFDGHKVDRYNYEEVSKKYSQMIKNLKKRKCYDMEYIFVPELHKDDAIHFHGLLKGVSSLNLKNSGKRDNFGRVIYNCDDFSLGFNTLTRISDPSKASTYMTKYITKEICYTLPGKHYWHSRGLNKIEENKMMFNDIEKKKVLIASLKQSDDLAGYYHTSIETNTFKNDFTYIVTHPGADGKAIREKLEKAEKSK